MEDGDWDSGGKALGMYLNGHGIAGARRPRQHRSSTTTSCSTSTPATTPQVTLPPAEYADAVGRRSSTPAASADDGRSYAAGDSFDAAVPHRVVVLREHREPEAEPDHSVAASVAAQAGTT